MKKLNYSGSIIVSDGMNPPIQQNVNSLSSFFKINQAPKMKKDVQKQLDKVPVSTGEYFYIELDSETFEDVHENFLEYDIDASGDGAELPSWLSLRGLSLMGTPPEKWRPLSYKLVLIAKNEFKLVKIPFTVNIKISLIYAMKLLGTYGGYLLTVLGIWYSINKFYNIFGKKYYIHPKKFLVEVGEEITPQAIYPIGFIAEEIKESKFILTKLEEFVTNELNLKVINPDKFISYFIDKSNNQLDKSRILQTIESIAEKLTIDEMREKLGLYMPGINSRKEIIEHITLNELTLRHLNSAQEKITKETFEKIKSKWVQFVEINKLGKFSIIQSNLLKELTDSKEESSLNNSQSLEEGLLRNSSFQVDPKINLRLLEDALLAHVFNFQNFNFHFMDIRILSKQKATFPSKLEALKTFLKLNLWIIDMSDKGKVGYGIRYKVEDNTLIFYGAPHRNMAGKTIVVQITNPRGKILRELWLDGVFKDKGKFEHEEKDIL